MACNSCSKPFSLLRKEKGCPSCGFSYCSKCLNDKIFVAKLNAEVKVCARCQRSSSQPNEPKTIEPPDAYYKRLGLSNVNCFGQKRSKYMGEEMNKDEEILNRLRKLKEDSKNVTPGITEDEITKRLQKIKGEMPSTSDEILKARLAKLKGVSCSTTQQTQTVLPAIDVRTQKEQADDLMKQYLDQYAIDMKYKEEFDGLVNDIESRLTKLKSGAVPGPSNVKPVNCDVEFDEEESIRKIVEKAKSEHSLEDELPPSSNDELPFCEICNEDAKMRCLGCKYLFCKRCFLEHKDDDDGCNRYEDYNPTSCKY